MATQSTTALSPSVIPPIRQQAQQKNTYEPIDTSDPISDTQDEQTILTETNMNYCPTFHIANIQSLVTATVEGKKIPFLKNQEKIPFLREQCKKEKPYFLGFAETYLKDGIEEAEYSIEGYSHITSHRPKREGGGVIIYINNNLTYQTNIMEKY